MTESILGNKFYEMLCSSCINIIMEYRPIYIDRNYMFNLKMFVIINAENWIINAVITSYIN